MNVNKKRRRLSSDDETDEYYVSSHSPVSKLIGEVNQLLRKPTINEELSTILDKFLEHLKESEKYLEEGILKINFAEASLLLQSSCELYGKKIDLLSNDVYESLQRWCSYVRTRDVPSTSNSQDEVSDQNQSIKCRKAIPPRSIKKFNEIRKLLKNSCHKLKLPEVVGSFSEDLDDLWSQASNSNFKLRKLRAKVSPFFEPHITKTDVFNKQNGNKLCNNDDLFINLYSVGKVVQDDKMTQFFNLRNLMDNIIQSYLAQNEITYTKLSDNNLWPDFKRYLESNLVKRIKKILRNHRRRRRLSIDMEPLITQQAPIDITMISLFGDFNINMDVFEVESDDEELTTVVLDDDDDDDDEEPVTVNISSNNISSRRISEINSEAESAFRDEDCSLFEEDETNNNGESQKDTNFTERNRNSLISPNDSGFYDEMSLRTKTPASEGTENDHSENEEYCQQMVELDESEDGDIEEFFGFSKNDYCNSLEISTKIKTEVQQLRAQFVTQKQGKKRKRQVKELLVKKQKTCVKSIKLLTTSLSKQENFFIASYKADKNETGIPPIPFHSNEVTEETTINSSNLLQEHDYCAAPPLESLILTQHPSPPQQRPRETISPSPTPEESPSPPPQEQQIMESDEEIEESPPMSPQSPLNDEEEEDDEENIQEQLLENNRIMEEASRRRSELLDWKNFIEAKIEEAEAAPEYDIHEYGSRIMNAVPLGESKPFESVLEEKSTPSEVSRYFLATLQLANTNNVKIIGVPQGQLANNKMQVKLVSKERYHDTLYDYVAPSEEKHKRLFKRRNI